MKKAASMAWYGWQRMAGAAAVAGDDQRR